MSYSIRICASRLKLTTRKMKLLKASELCDFCKINQWQYMSRQTHTSVSFFKRFINNLHPNCHTTALPLIHRAPSPNKLQKRMFSLSSQHFVNRTYLLQSSNTSRKSASVIATSPMDVKESPSNSQSNRLQPSTQSQSDLLHLRYIYVHTSVNRWEDVPGGLMFDTAYLDSRPGERINPAEPLVVSVHSTPGSMYDMQPVLENFVKSGCRVLAPAFPGAGCTEGVLHVYNDVFSHSTSEKAEFVRDFLLALDVNKVDLLLGHGCGCYPTMRLTAGKDTNTMFKSTAFISPWPNQTFRAMRQKNILILLHDMWERPFYRPLARALSRMVFHTRNTSALERMAFIYTLYHLDFSEVGGFGVALESQQFPRAMFFAEDDAMVEAQLSYQLAGNMGIGERSVHHFDGQLTKEQMEQFPSCLVFDKGGQSVQSKHSGVITAVLFNLLKSVRPTFASL